MKTLLLNGCSFADCWTPTEEFVKYLDCDNLVNLGIPGTGFQRTCRSTVEWIAQNGNPHMVIIPITVTSRWELALNQDEDDIDGSWVPLQNSNYLSDTYDLQDTSIDDVKKLVDMYYKVIPTIKTYWDKMFTEIITFSAFLENQKINYLMWDMVNGFDRIHIKGYSGFEKLKLIEQNRNIVDLFSFCGNRYMRDTMPEDLKQKTPEFAHHHNAKQYKELERYLVKYLNSLDQ